MKYYMPTEIYFGNGNLNKTQEIVKENNPENILLITGKNFAKKAGLQEKLSSNLKDYQVNIYDKVNPIPKLEDVEDALRFAKQQNIDLIIGLGGGSVLDISKITSIMLRNEGNVLDYVNKKIKNRGITLIAIPTTSGTGSEVSPFAAFYYNKKKQSFGGIKDHLVYPHYAVVDPELTLTMPNEVVASSGLDALSQALESYWSINSNDLSDIHAIQSIKLILTNLENSYLSNDLKYKYNMSKASLEAGLAFSQTATTAPHSVSYPMTAHFNLSHGFACALTLPEFLRYNYEINKDNCIDERGHIFVREKLDNLLNELDMKSLLNLSDSIKNLMIKVNAPLTLSKVGIENYNVILEEGFTPERMSNNPRLVTKEDLARILYRIR